MGYIGGASPDDTGKPDLKFWVLQIFNLMNVILGSGILAMPYVMATVGYGTFMVSLAAVSCLGLFAIDNLTILCEKYGISSYEALAEKALGLPGKMYTIACIYFHTLIAMVSYMIIVKGELPEVLIALSKGGSCPENPPIWTNGNFVFIMVLIVFVIPLSVLRRLDFLGFTSGIAMILMGIFSVVVACYSFIVDCETIGDVNIDGLNNATCTTFEAITAENAGHEYQVFQEAVNQNNTDICDLKIVNDLSKFKAITAFPIILFAMMCQESVLTIYDELQFQSRDVLMKIAKISFLMIFVIYSTVAFFGYKTWGGYTISEVLIMYTINFADSPWIILARVCSLTCVILSTPLLHFPNRRALLILIFGEKHQFSWGKWIGAMTFSFTIVVVLVGWFAKSLGQMFTYAGIITANSLMLILPALFYYKLEDDPARATRKNVSLGVVIFGVLFLIVNFILQVGQDTGMLSAQ